MKYVCPAEQTVHGMDAYQPHLRQEADLQNWQRAADIKTKEINPPINKWTTELNKHLKKKKTMSNV